MGITKTTSQQVYLMVNEFGLHKIGISIDPMKRARDISNNSGVSTSVLKTWPSQNAARTEKRLHKKFQNCRTKGEWFKLTEIELLSLDNEFYTVDSEPDVEPIVKTNSPKKKHEEIFTSAVVTALEWIVSDVDVIYEPSEDYWNAISLCVMSGVPTSWLIKYGFLCRENEQKAINLLVI